MRKILAITGNRADYDLMVGVYSLLNSDPDIDFRLIVGGAHLSHQFGATINNVIADGFEILLKIESLINSDSPQSRLKSASIFLQNCIDVVACWSPDLIIYAGDREEVFIGALLGAYLYIPTIHFFGGDHETDGHPDTVIRHATSKLSTFHLVSHQSHRERLISIGESPERIEVIGSVALDKFNEDISSDVNSILPLGKDLDGYALVIYHPINSAIEDSVYTYSNIITALKDYQIPGILIYPNSDPGSGDIIRLIENLRDDARFWAVPSFDRKIFLSLFKSAKFLIGNSSAGILEAASISKPVINVGNRQVGRFADENVIFCKNHLDFIKISINTILSTEFQDKISAISNSYGNGDSSKHAYRIIKNTSFSQIQMKIKDPLVNSP